MHLAEMLSTVTVSDAARNTVTNPPQVFASNSKCLFEGVGAGKLAPDSLQAILIVRQPEGVTLPKLMEPITVEWALQGARCPDYPDRAYHRRAGRPPRHKSICWLATAVSRPNSANRAGNTWPNISRLHTAVCMTRRTA